jgi:hypothetical protein
MVADFPILYNLVSEGAGTIMLFEEPQCSRFQCHSNIQSLLMKVYGGEKGCTQVGRPVVRKTLGRPKCRWEDNIKMDLPDGGAWAVSIWLRTGTGGGLL